MVESHLHERVPATERQAPTQSVRTRLRPDQALLLYDEECPFCRSVAGALVAWDRAGRLVPIEIQSPSGADVLSELTPNQRLAVFHLITADGDRYSGGPALVPMFERLPGGKALAAPASRFDRASARFYDLVSEHRDLLVKLIPAPLRRWGDRRLAERSGEQRWATDTRRSPTTA